MILNLSNIDKKDYYTLSSKLTGADIKELVELLTEKDNEIRYNAFCILEQRSLEYNDVYPYIDMFINKLKSDNSYQRSIGLMLIAANTRWDSENKIDSVFDLYLSLATDEKPITARQCLQSIYKILPFKENLWKMIVEELINIDILEFKETMRKSIVLDIISVLNYIKKEKYNAEINKYYNSILESDIFDINTLKLLKKEMDIS